MVEGDGLLFRPVARGRSAEREDGKLDGGSAEYPARELGETMTGGRMLHESARRATSLADDFSCSARRAPARDREADSPMKDRQQPRVNDVRSDDCQRSAGARFRGMSRRLGAPNATALAKPVRDPRMNHWPVELR